ncbi:MAG TPA: HupE/UreJ family protein [Polyangiaceae bacterium]|nr:HupE/UreJ family protein [Polyangiaceae bacterium]
MTRSRQSFVRFALALVVLTRAGVAAAHASAPTSLVVLDVLARDVNAELELPLDQLALARGVDVGRGRALTPAETESLRVYLGEHIRLSSPGGRAWRSRFGDFSVRVRDGVPAVHASAVFAPESGADTGQLELFDDAILHRVVSHRIYVALRRDFGRGQLDAPERVIGVCLFSQKTIVLDRRDESAWRGFVATARLGMRHIADGVDHLLFLFLLLLVAPLIASREAGRVRWSQWRTPRDSLRATLIVVTAFTAGHSVSLAAAAFGVVRLPARAVEASIAVSILVTAVHAVRPLIPRGERYIAATFGLIHGFAFAETLAALGFHGPTLALSLLGFNLGIEVMQLAVVVAVVPWLLLMRDRPMYASVRVTCASIGFAAASAWLVERLTGKENAASHVLALAVPHAWIAVPSLAVIAVVTKLGARTESRAPRPTTRSTSGRVKNENVEARAASELGGVAAVGAGNGEWVD